MVTTLHQPLPPLPRPKKRLPLRTHRKPPSPPPPRPPPRPPAPPPAPPRPATATAPDWPHPNYDASGSRATFTSTITSKNVGSLKEVWRYELPSGGAFGIVATTPIIVGNTVYLGDLQTNVHAIDLQSGNRRWIVDNEQWVYGPSGVAVSGGCVFSNLGGHSVAAYRALDGELVWDTNILENGGAVNFQPLVVGGTVFAATSSLSQPGARGALYALDPSTGQIRWSFNTIVSEDVWGNPKINSGGGAWYPPALDLEAGVSYWGTSNPYPYPGVPGYPNGASRPGDNRWTDSILAVDIATGELRWGVQHIPHDIFDRDAVLTGIATLDDGSQVIISTGKLGRVIGLDPDGAVLWDTPVGIHQNDDLTEFEGEIEVLPGNAGGVVTPMAVAEGMVYVSVVNAPTTYKPDVPEGTGTSLGVHPSQLVAIDAATATSSGTPTSPATASAARPSSTTSSSPPSSPASSSPSTARQARSSGATRPREASTAGPPSPATPSSSRSASATPASSSPSGSSSDELEGRPMRSVRAVTVSVLAAHALAWAAVPYLAFVPFYRTSDGDSAPPAAIITFLLFPALLTLPAVATVLFVRKWRWRWFRRVVLWGSAIVFLGLCILTGFTVGLFFLPAALALFVTAGFDLDQKQSAS